MLAPSPPLGGGGGGYSIKWVIQVDLTRRDCLLFGLHYAKEYGRLLLQYFERLPKYTLK